MQIIQKLTIAKRMMATEGAAATMRFTSGWIGRRFWHVISGPPPQAWRKFDLINELAHIHGYRSVLEISTAVSGFTFDQLDLSRFDVCRRLSYLTPDDWTDGAPVHYRCRDRNTSECVRQIRAQGQRFDIVFVDACHEYESSRRDIQDAIGLVNDDGIIVLHDCAPEGEAYCMPTRGDMFVWFGVTYKAYLDVLISRKDLWYCTVDTDTGCGIIRLNQKNRLFKRAADRDEACFRTWRNLGDDYNSAFQIYGINRNALMNIVTAEEFLAAERQIEIASATM